MNIIGTKLSSNEMLSIKGGEEYRCSCNGSSKGGYYCNLSLYACEQQGFVLCGEAGAECLLDGGPET